VLHKRERPSGNTTLHLREGGGQIKTIRAMYYSKHTKKCQSMQRVSTFMSIIVGYVKTNLGIFQLKEVVVKWTFNKLERDKMRQ